MVVSSVNGSIVFSRLVAMVLRYSLRVLCGIIEMPVTLSMVLRAVK